jgi:mRNA interferase HigB
MDLFFRYKKDFNSVDSVGNQRFVFNIKGNDYRLIVIIRFSIQRIYIRFVGTHEDYNKIYDIKNI